MVICEVFTLYIIGNKAGMVLAMHCKMKFKLWWKFKSLLWWGYYDIGTLF